VSVLRGPTRERRGAQAIEFLVAAQRSLLPRRQTAAAIRGAFQIA
jgi:hypothetical protein